MLFDEALLPQLTVIDLNNFSCIRVAEAGKYVRGDLPGLMEKIKTYNPGIDFPVVAQSNKRHKVEEFVFVAE